jgi:hypothetical protein
VETDGAAVLAAAVVAAEATEGGAVAGVGNAQPASTPRIAAATAWPLPMRSRRAMWRGPFSSACTMWILMLEMLAALALLVFIVWWTMFSGRRRGERRHDDEVS